MKVLHITNWYPTVNSPNSAIWIKRHLDALAIYAENEILHLEIKKGKISFSRGSQLYGNASWILSLPFKFWKLDELIYGLLLLWIFRKKSLRKYDVINFHIAYPVATKLHWVRRRFSGPIFINEHWSAYHFNFGVANVAKLSSIRRIFFNDIRLLTISEALGNDIKKFTQNENLDFQVIPNVVDHTLFYWTPKKKLGELCFFMISQWKWPKDPINMLETIKELAVRFPEIKVRIAGYGPLEAEILNWIEANESKIMVEYLGKLDAEQVAEELNNASYLIHRSSYETFSVVCAEAISCGCPVIASAVGGITEFIDSKNGVLVAEHELWNEVLEKLLTDRPTWDRVEIAAMAHNRFNPRLVGQRYYDLLSKAIK